MLTDTTIVLPKNEDMIRQVPQGGRAIELGVLAGGYSAAILGIMRPDELVLVDCWKHQVGAYELDSTDTPDDQQEALYQSVKSHFAPYPEVRIIRSFTHDAVSQFPDEYFDFLYLDACHLYAAVKQDLADWYPKVKHGGLFAGHDYFDVDVPFIQVRSAVDEFCEANGLSLNYIVKTHCGAWGIVKP